MYPPKRLARIAGVFYLMVAIFALFAHTTGTSVYVSGNAAATARNVVADATVFRLGALADLVQATCMLFTGLALYLLLKHVNKNVARVMMVFVVVMTAVVLPNTVYRFASLIVATDGTYTAALGADGSDALVLLLLDMHTRGVLVSGIFFGLWLLPLGYLVHRSGMFPRALGILLMTVGCFGYLTNLIVRFLAPDVGATLGPFFTTPAGLVEFALVVWLLAKGVTAPRHDGRVTAHQPAL